MSKAAPQLVKLEALAILTGHTCTLRRGPPALPRLPNPSIPGPLSRQSAQSVSTRT